MTRTILLLFVGSLYGHAQPVSNIFRSTISFEENKGQIADHHGMVQDDILFSLKDKGVTVFFRQHGLSYQWNAQGKNLQVPASISEATGKSEINLSPHDQLEYTQFFRIDMGWDGASDATRVTALEPTDGVANYYLSHCDTGVKNVRSYKKIIYHNIYPGINLEYYVNDNGHLKYDVILSAGADPSLLSYSYQGAVPILKDGRVRVNTPMGYLEEQVPVAWILGSENEKVDVRFRKSNNGIGYKISTHDRPVVLDPEIIWSTYYGGTSADAGYSTKVDGSGNVFLAGETSSTTGIASAPGCITTKSSALDAFIVKFNSDGATRVWATYYGGTGNEGAKAMAVESSGNVYIVGSTTSTAGLPNTTYQPTYGGGSQDAFLAKFDNSGSCLWATFYGFNDTQRAAAVVVDGAGNVYMAGYTDGSIADIADSPIGHDMTYSNPQFSGFPDAFLVKFNSSGTSRLWVTYYGGEYTEEANALTTDSQNNVYLAGVTSSATGDSETDIATQGAFMSSKNTSDYDGFLVKFNEAGIRQWGTYIGGSGDDVINSISLDQVGNIYLGGSTASTANLGTTTESYQQSKGGGSQDAFVAKLNAGGTSLLWASYFGGTNEDLGHSIAVDMQGHVFLSGRTTSGGLASKGFQNTISTNYDAYVVMFSVDGKNILWSTYYGGTNNDFGQSITKDFAGIYMAGTTASSGLSKDGFQANYAAGGSDAFLVKIEVPEFTEETFPNTAEKNGATPVTTKLNAIGNSTVKFWRKGISGAKDNWISETILPSGTTFTKNLSSSDLTDPIGISYYFEIIDNSLATYQSSPEKLHIHYDIGDNTIPSLRFGSKVEDYQIVSMPLVFDNDAVTAVFDEFGAYNKKKWRLFRYYDNDNREYPGFAAIQPGLGYWLIAKNSVVIDPGAGQTVPVDDDNPFTIPLTTGWNLIGNPYDFRISWQEVLDFNNNPTGVGNLKTFSNGALIESDVLDRYRGAFVFADVDVTLEIPVLRNVSLGGRKGSPASARNPIDNTEWDVPLHISNQNLTNELGGIGMHPQARLKGKDPFDEVSVPLIEGMGFFEIQMEHPEVHASFSRDVVPTAENHTWNINIRRDNPIPVEIRWDNTSFGNNDKQLYLLNPTTLQVVDMRAFSKMFVGTETNQVMVIYGSQSFVDEVLDLQLPALGKPFPVPASGRVNIPVWIPTSVDKPYVKIDVYDSTGKIISNLVDSHLPPGRHIIPWESDHSGLYFVQMRMNTQTITRKLIMR